MPLKPMDARRALQLILLFLLPLFAHPGHTESRAQVIFLIQHTPLAGSQYYALTARWQSMQVGDPLLFIREPQNHHDPLAIRVEWQGEKIGYLPRTENDVLAHAMDRGVQFIGKIVNVQNHPDPWQRLQIAVYVKR